MLSCRRLSFGIDLGALFCFFVGVDDVDIVVRHKTRRWMNTRGVFRRFVV